MQTDPSSTRKWQPLFDESCNEMLSVEPHCPAVLLMRGLLQLMNKKTGLVININKLSTNNLNFYLVDKDIMYMFRHLHFRMNNAPKYTTYWCSFVCYS